VGLRVVSPAFDSDWADPCEWVALYRDLGMQVVPCHRPAGATDATWKHPKLATWAQFATEPIPETVYEKWYGDGGEFARSRQMGMITGGASGRIVCLDLDTHKNPAAADWWQGLITVENYGHEPETWKAISGSGGRHFFFRYPAGFAMPTAKTALGVDVRGQGGFIVLAPTLHNCGRAYAWQDGCAPWECDLATAPDWLVIGIEELIRRHGGGGNGRERTASEAEFNSFGRRVDGRETYMATSSGPRSSIAIASGISQARRRSVLSRNRRSLPSRSTGTTSPRGCRRTDRARTTASSAKGEAIPPSPQNGARLS
jgi:hypothetical protein